MPDPLDELIDGPPAPENVRLVLDDGTEIPMEMRYLGVVNQVHQWENVMPVALRRGTAFHPRVQRLPSMTAISFHVTFYD